MSVALSKKGPVLASDFNLSLISLYSSIRNGWDPPTETTVEQYHLAKTLPDTDPLKAFHGFGCSFGGKWFGGYAKGFNGPLTYPQLAARNSKRSVAAVNGEISHVDFLSVTPGPTYRLIYCDPPYAGTTSYAALGSFDYNKFLDRVKDWSNYTDVFVSEYEFPLGQVIWSHKAKTTLAALTATNKLREERLYHIPKST